MSRRGTRPAGLAVPGCAVVVGGFLTVVLTAQGSPYDRTPKTFAVADVQPPPGKGGPAHPATAGMSYPSEGIDTAAPPAARTFTPADADAVLTSLRSQGALPVVRRDELRSAPNVVWRTVTEAHPTAAGVSADVPYPGVVVTYGDVTPLTYGSAPLSVSPNRCSFVAIFDEQIQSWTDFFVTC